MPSRRRLRATLLRTAPRHLLLRRPRYRRRRRRMGHRPPHRRRPDVHRGRRPGRRTRPRWRRSRTSRRLRDRVQGRHQHRRVQRVLDLPAAPLAVDHLPVGVHLHQVARLRELLLVEVRQLLVPRRHHPVDRPRQPGVLRVELGQQRRHLVLPREGHALRQRPRQHDVARVHARVALAQLVGEGRAGRGARRLTGWLGGAEQRRRVPGLAAAGLASLAEFTSHVLILCQYAAACSWKAPRRRVNRPIRVKALCDPC